MHCPSCGAQIEADTRFAHLVVCEYCDSAIVVDEKAARISGKMAVLAQSSGPLYVTGNGDLDGRRFTVLGRVRYGYSKGYWDEWYLRFDDDTTAWISEDGDDYTLESCNEGEEMPAEFATIQPGDQVAIGDTTYHVDEKDIAECEGGAGQLPFSVLTGEKTPFLDLSADADTFATVEFDLDDETSRIFLGRRIDQHTIHMDQTAEEAGVAQAGAAAAERAGSDGKRERVVKQGSRAQEIKCYYCAAPLQIPDSGAESMECQYCGSELDLTLRKIQCEGCGATVPMHGGNDAKSVRCSFCGSQMDVTRSEPSLLGTITDDQRPDVPFKLGQTFNFRDAAYLTVGHLRYKEGFYRWDEFLLHNNTTGYHWLIMAEGHFSFGQAIPERPNGIDLQGGWFPDSFEFQGHKWDYYEDGTAEITFVDGEMPWVAALGDQAKYMDAVDPPYKLSAEWTATEAEWFLLEYVPHSDVAAGFNMSEDDLPPLRGIAPNMPYPAGAFRRQYPFVTGLFAAIFLVLTFYAWFISGTQVSELQITPEQYAAEYVTESFDVSRSNAVCKAKLHAPVSNGWVYLDMALLDDQDRALSEFSSEISYYHGRSGGESWSEGSRNDTVLFKLREPGTYRFLVYGQAGTGSSPASDAARTGKTVRIRVYEGVMTARWFVLGALTCIGATVLEIFRHRKFEAERMGEDDD